MHDIKRHFIRSLLFSQPVLGDGIPEEEVGYFTYFTNIGIIVGKKAEFEMLNSESTEAFQKDLTRRLENHESINLYQIALANLDLLLKSAKGIDYNDENSDVKAIALEDVYIKSTNNQTYKLSTFILFTDQITGLVPGKINFD